MTGKKNQEETLKRFIQERGLNIPKAPPPITPVSGYGVTLSRPPKTNPQEELFVPLTGTELMKKWSVGWEAIFDFARQDRLTPYEPERFRSCIEYDFGMLSLIYSPKEREGYFSQWLYHLNDVKAFEAQYEEILDAWRKSESQVRHENDNIKEIQRQFLSKAGEKGGSQSKKNQPILAAACKYMGENPKTNDMTNGRIANLFCKKYNENKPIIVIIDQTQWEVFCLDRLIFSRIFESYNKRPNNKEKSITYTTFRNVYIPSAKKSILPDTSQ